MKQSTTKQIMNSTIAKLNRVEIADLGLIDKGIWTYKGTLKTRKQGFKTSVLSDKETQFVNDSWVMEFIEIEPLGEEKEYAMRVFNKRTQDYEEFFPVLWGIEFFK